jgi:hypothetical protein
MGSPWTICSPYVKILINGGTTTSLELDNIHTTILLIRPILLPRRL